MAYDYTYTSNRGISGYPQQYFAGWQQGGQQQGPSSSWNQPAPDAVGQWAQYANAQQQPQQQSPLAGLLSMFPTSIYNFGGGAQPAATGARRGVGRQNRSGGYGGVPQQQYQTQAPASGVPPATTQPQTPVGGSGGQQGDLGSLLGTYTNPITAGQLSNDAISRALGTINAGAPAWAVQKYGGAFGDNLTNDLERSSINLSRAASEQQSSMDLAHQRAKAGAGLDMAGLLQQLNAQNVTSGLNNQDSILRAVLGLFGGLL